MKKPRRIVLRSLVLFLLFLLLDVAMETRDLFERDETSCEAVTSDATPSFYEPAYSFLTRNLLEASPSGRVTVVYIPEDLVDVQQDLCGGRAYLAKLISIVAQKRPAAIVLDKYFSGQACQAGTQKAATGSLLSAVQAARALGIPVIVGEATGLAQVRTLDTCLVAKPDFLHFDATADVPKGVTKLNGNREQIPLQWPVLNNSLSGRTDRPSLALLTTSAVAPQRVLDARFQEMLHDARQPYGSLGIPLESIPSTDVIEEHAAYRSKFRDKVVVFGSQNSVDRWVVLGKARWGYELQAGYIEALLSGSYLRAVSGHSIFLLSVLFVLCLEVVPLGCELAEHFFTKQRKKLKLWSDFWVVIWPVAFAAIVVGVCIARQFLPPVSVLVASLFTMVARVIFSLMIILEGTLYCP